MTKVQKEALKHAGMVFVYAGLSSVIPLLMAWLENDERYALLIPVINALWMGFRKFYLLTEAKK